MLWNNTSEGAAVWDTIWMLLPWQCLLFLIPVLVLQIVLLYRHAPPKSFYSQRLKWSLCLIVCYGTLLCVLNEASAKRKLWGAKAGHSNGARCAKFGFTPVFVSDLVFRFTCVDALQVEALKNESQRSFGLQAEHDEFPFGDIVVLQVESLDNALIDFCVNGKPVIPFLNSLQKNSLTYRILASHRYGSATADFEMLNGISPLEGFFNYRVPGLPYNTSLPRFFREQGYETFSFHGVSGSFYNRRAPFTEMKFDHIFFRDDIVKAVREGKYPLSEEIPEAELEEELDDDWLDDDIVLKTALREIRSPSERNRFFFVITATSHGPYKASRLEEDMNTLIPNAASQQDTYLNLMYNVDDWLRSFYEGLPQGTLLVIYGDHTPGFRTGTFVSDIEGHRDFVPCIIHVVGEDLAAFQKVPRCPTDTTLSVRDVHSYLREITERDAALSRTESSEDWKDAKKDAPNVF